MKVTPVTWFLGIGVVAACGVTAAAVHALEISPPPPAPVSPSPPPATPLDSTPPGVKMASIPGGTFTMGDGKPGSSPSKSATVAAFSMDVNLVTVAGYAACVQAGKCEATGDIGGCNAKAGGKDKHPINCVSHNQAQAYCAWAGKRLPTEEEWEYAARGGSKGTAYSWGDDAPDKQLCWKRDSAAGTCEVGSFPAGAFGLFDMNGNVWQQTSTAYGTQEFILKGSTWTRTMAREVRSVLRANRPADMTNVSDGFRCAK
jgi:formylglycine-generating enzyme required for sulfatase activity